MSTKPPSNNSSSNSDDLLTEPLFIAFLLSLPELGVRRYWRLYQRLGDWQRLFHWPLSQLLDFLPKEAQPAFADFYLHRWQSRCWCDFVALCQPLLADGVVLLSHLDSRYPPLLATIAEPPPLLYVRGDVAALSGPQLAFVGSRNASRYGKEAAFAFARYLAGLGLTVTSGLAVGIDGQSHRGAVAAGGTTVAILGTGIDHIYPHRHRALAAEIVAGGGALVSEFLPGSQPHSANFPRRNRIISGLSLGVLVVEAALKSGSLITARLALEQNRDVFAIPGSINSPLSRGCHALIRDGATLVETAEDIGRELSHWLTSSAQDSAMPPSSSSAAPSEQIPAPVQSAEERTLWACLCYEPSSVDQLVAQSQLGAATVLALLSHWQLLGLVQAQNESYLRVTGY
ncbi:MAG: DNA-protecting protein DprA [Gammaproteobacteria bacterium]|nr:DNA-protecting protein DprA [Gammaproteobacteria bacterium]